MAKAPPFGRTVAALKDKMKEGLSGAYLFFGQEELLKHFYLEKFIDRVEKEGFAEFNLARLDFSREATLGDLADEIGVLPMMGETRLVIVRGLEPLKLNDADTEYLFSILKTVPETTACVLYCTDEEFDPAGKARSRFLKNAETALFPVRFPLQDERTLIGWSQKLLAREGKTADVTVIRHEMRICLGKMQIMQKEWDKLIRYADAHDRSVITEEDVALFAADRSEYAYYQLTDAVLAGAFPASERIFSAIRRAGGNQWQIPLVAMLSRAFVNATLAASGTPAADALAATGISDWQYRNLRESVYGIPRENLREALRRCLECDKKLKGFRSDASLLTEELVLGLCALCKRAHFS